MSSQESGGINGIMHGPYRPLSDEEIAAAERDEYGRVLSELGRVTLQVQHQLESAAWAWVDGGRPGTPQARDLFTRAQVIHLRLLGGRDDLPLRERI